MKMTEGCKLGK